MNKLTIDSINTRKPKRSRLTVLYFDGHITHGGNNLKAVMCKCECGKELRTVGTIVALGRALSCGCLPYENKTIGMRQYKISTTGEYKALYHSFHSMMKRCYNKKCREYKFYGGKGVEVCKEWKYNYDAFSEWALNNGWEKGLQLDKDKIGNGFLYSPLTCCWLTQTENNKYRHLSSGIKIEYHGIILTLTDISKIEKIDRPLIKQRLDTGKDIYEAVKMGNTRHKANYQRLNQFNNH